MKAMIKAMAAVTFLCAGFMLSAQEDGETASGTAGIPLSISEKKISDLTVGDLAAIASMQSVERQKRHYVGSSAVASFLVPGLGQFKTGDYLGGSLHLAGQLALSAGAMYGAWALMPAELRKSDLSRDERRDLMKEYRDSGKEDQLYASAAVMTGGFVLSVIHSVWAASDARNQAIENIDSGKATFEPSLFIGPHGMGPSLRIRW